MAMTFSSQGCKSAADDLNKSANKLSDILNSRLTGKFNQIRQVYQSEAAEDVYAAFNKMKQEFPNFIKSVDECSKYLSETVAPTYEKLEKAVSSKVN